MSVPLEHAARHTLKVLDWLAENSPDCFGWDAPYPSTTPSIKSVADLLRDALSEATHDRG